MLADVLYAPLYADILDVLYGEDGAIPSFQLNLNSSLTPKYALGSMTPSYTRATTATFTDYQGKNTDALSNQARIEGNRVVRNLITASEDMTNGAYATGGGGGITVDSATQATFDGTFDSIYQAVTIVDDGSGAGGRTFTFSVSVRLVSGTITADSNVYLDMQGNAINNTANQNIGSSITSTAQRFSITQSTDAAGTSVEALLLSRNDAITLEITDWQLEEVTGNITHAPSEYVSTGVGTGGELWDNTPDTVAASWTDNGDGSWTHDGTAGTNDATESSPFLPAAGKTYVATYTVSDYTAGTFLIGFSGGTGSPRTANGTYTEAFTPASTTFFTLRAQSSFAGTVSDISVKEADHGLNRDGVKAFNYHNGNTVASTGVVTEAQGPAINSSTSQWVELDGAAGNRVDTPSTSNVNQTGDFTFIFWVAPDDETPSAAQAIASNYNATGNQRGYLFRIGTGGLIESYVSTSGSDSPFAISTAAPEYGDGVGYWGRVDVSVTNSTGNFFTSQQPIGTALSDLSWTQLGDADVAYSASITGGLHASTADFMIGARDGGGATDAFAGKVARAVIISGSDHTATPVVDFNANDYEAGKTWETQSFNTEVAFDASDFTDGSDGGGVVTESNGTITATDGTGAVRYQHNGFSTVSGEDYIISVSETSGNSISFYAGTSLAASDTFSTSISANSTKTVRFTAGGSTTFISLTDADSFVASGVTVTKVRPIFTLNGTARVFSPFAAWGDLPGSSGDYFSTPDSAAASITSDISVIGWAALDDWTPAGDSVIASKYTNTGDNRSYLLQVDTTGVLNFAHSSNGTIGATVTEATTIAPGFSNGTGHWVGVSFDSSSGETNFYTSEDSPLTPYNKITWTLLESVSGTAAAIYDATAVVEVGGHTLGTANVASGKIARAAIFASTDLGANTAPSVDFDARAFTPGVSTATMSTGEVFTANGNVSIEQNIPSPWDASGPLGYLSEQAGTNILLQSNQFDTTWTNTNSIETANYAIAPDGTKTAWRLIDDSATGTGVVALVQSLTVASGSPSVNIVSVHAKQDQLTTLAIATTLYDTTEQSWFDLSAGTIGTTAHDNAWMEPLGDGWYRCSVEFQTTTDLAGTIQLRAAAADNNSTVDLDGTSSILVWGAQVEASSFPTTYIPTTSTSATRNADVLTYSAVGNADSFPMTASYDYTPSQVSANATTLGANDSTNTERWRVLVNTSGQPNLSVVDGGVVQATITSGTGLIAGVSAKIAGAVALNDVEIYQSGISTGTDTSATTPTVDTISVGCGFDDATQPNGNIRNVKIFNKRLNDNQVGNL